MPTIQLFNITPSLDICLEHINNPIGCFSAIVSTKASRETYSDLSEYRNSWLPALRMEAAVDAVNEGFSSRILNVPVLWHLQNKRKKKTTAEFTLTQTFCAKRFLFHVDLSRTNETIHSILGDLVCVRYKSKGSSMSPVWVAHCIIIEATGCDDRGDVTIVCELHQSGQNIPAEIIEEEVDCTIEWIPIALPLRYAFLKSVNLKLRVMNLYKRYIVMFDL